MVGSIKKPTKIKKYKWKKRDRKYRTTKKKLLPRRSFKKKVKKQQRGGEGQGDAMNANSTLPGVETTSPSPPASLAASAVVPAPPASSGLSAALSALSAQEKIEDAMKIQGEGEGEKEGEKEGVNNGEGELPPPPGQGIPMDLRSNAQPPLVATAAQQAAAGPVAGLAAGPAAEPVEGPVAGLAAGPVAGLAAGPAAEPVEGPAAEPVEGPVIGLEAYEEFLESSAKKGWFQHWHNPNHQTLAHFVKVIQDIIHDFLPYIDDLEDYEKTCEKLILNTGLSNVYQNERYVELFQNWKDSPKSIKERFLLLHVLSTIPSDTLETQISIFDVFGNTVNKLCGVSDPVIYEHLYFATDAFSSATAFQTLVDNKFPDLMNKGNIINTNKTWANIFDPASLSNNQHFFENNFRVEQQNDFKSKLQESMQLYFDVVVKHFTPGNSYEIVIDHIAPAAGGEPHRIFLTIKTKNSEDEEVENRYVHTYGDNSIAKISMNQVNAGSTYNGKKYISLSNFFNNMLYPYLKYVYKSMGDWIQPVYARKLNDYLQNDNIIIAMKTIDKFLVGDTIWSGLDLTTAKLQIYDTLKARMSAGAQNGGADTSSDDDNDINTGIFSFFGKNIHNSSLDDYMVFSSIMSNFDFVVPEEWINGVNKIEIPNNAKAFAWLDKIDFKNTDNNTKWREIENQCDTLTDFLKRIITICDDFKRYTEISKEIEKLTDEMDRMMIDISIKTSHIHDLLKEKKRIDKSNIERLSKLFKKLQDKIGVDKGGGNALHNLFMRPCIKRLENEDIDLSKMNNIRKQTTGTVYNTAKVMRDLAEYVQNKKPRQSTRSSSRLKLTHSTTNLSDEEITEQASGLIRDSMGAIAEIYSIISILPNTKGGNGSSGFGLDLAMTIVMHIKQLQCKSPTYFLILEQFLYAYTCYLITYEIIKDFHSNALEEIDIPLLEEMDVEDRLQFKLKNNTIGKKKKKKNKTLKKKIIIRNIITNLVKKYKSKDPIDFDYIINKVKTKGKYNPDSTTLQYINNAISYLIGKKKISLETDGTIKVRV